MSNFLQQVTNDDFCYLTTIGRVSGRQHTIEIWFGINGSTLYMMAGDHESDWVKNLRKQPQVTVRIRERIMNGMARTVEAGTQEDATARRIIVAKYQPRDSDDLTEWGQTALVVAVDGLNP